MYAYKYPQFIRCIYTEHTHIFSWVLVGSLRNTALSELYGDDYSQFMLLLLLTKVKSLERNIVCLNTQNNLFKRKTNTNSFMTSNWRGATGSQTKVSFRIFFLVRRKKETRREWMTNRRREQEQYKEKKLIGLEE